jgi:protein-S-isoprenylcysteine O-methyltransferase Ste14
MNAKPESEPLVTPVEATDQPPAAEPAVSPGRRRGGSNMLPERDRRSPPERLLVRLIATCGIVGIGVAIAAIMHSSGSHGWLIGLVVSIVSVVLAAVLWSSRVL